MNTHEKWEYTDYHNILRSDLIRFLNQMRQDGWELCLVRGGNKYVFKRKVSPNEEGK